MHKLVRILAVVLLVATSSYASAGHFEFTPDPPTCFDLPTCAYPNDPDLRYSHPCIVQPGGYTSYVYINQVTDAWCLYGPILP